MGIGQTYEVLVSKHVRTDHNIPGHKMTLADRPIFKPQAQDFWLCQENIDWHRKSIYRK